MERTTIKEILNITKTVIEWEDYHGLALIILGVLSMYFDYIPQLGPELIGIGMTVIIIENPYQIRIIRLQNPLLAMP